MTEGLVTVVIPIYNVEWYLDRCIASVVHQTYKNLEIILVDDGSPDRCPQICDEWAKRDSRIKVIHKENAGLGMARNTGIDYASGEYICFFDSDDYVEPMTIEECYRSAKEEDADLVCFGNDRVTQDGKKCGERIPNPPKTVFSGKEIREKLMPMSLSYNARTGENWNLSLSACFSMFSLMTIKKCSWKFVSEREIISEDYYSVLKLYEHIDKVVFLRDVFYHYTLNANSLTSSYRNDRHDKNKYFARAMIALSENMGCRKLLEDRIATVFLGFTIGVMKQIVAHKGTLQWKSAELKRILDDEYCQNVLRADWHIRENVSKKILFWSMRNKSVLLCYLLVKLRNYKR